MFCSFAAVGLIGPTITLNTGTQYKIWTAWGEMIMILSQAFILSHCEMF